MRCTALLATLLLCGCSSALHDAAKRDDAEAIKRGIAEGLDPNMYSEGTGVYSPLYYAASRGNNAAVKALLEGGADPLRATSTRTGSQIAAKFGHPDTAAIIASYERRTADKGGAPLPPAQAMTLCKTLIKGDRDGAAALLDRGVDPNARVDNGYTLFNCAIQSKRADLVRLLLERGARRSAAFESPGWGRPTDYEFAQNMRLSEIAAMFTEEPRKPTLGDDAKPQAAAEAKAPASDVDSPSFRAAERPDDYALVIGIEEYQSLPKAEYGARDAKTVRRHLEALGFPARNVVSLEGSQATASKLKSYLEEWLPLNVKPESTLFVYYSGHGAPDPKTGDAYLVPWDGDPKFLKSTALPLKALYAGLSKTKAKRVVVALDACFSGAGGRSVLAQGARPLVAKVDDGVPASDRLTVLAAASGDEITGTLSEQGHGMFTYHLLKGLAAEPGASARSLYSYLKPRVQDDARRDNREQTPTLAGAALDAPLLGK